MHHQFGVGGHSHHHGSHIHGSSLGHRPDSRASNASASSTMQDPMRQMMNMSLEGPGSGGSVHSNPGGTMFSGDIRRTDSPSSFNPAAEAPSPFIGGTELPTSMASNKQGMYVMQQQHQPGVPQQQHEQFTGSDGYFSAHQHSGSM